MKRTQEASYEKTLLTENRQEETIMAIDPISGKLKNAQDPEQVLELLKEEGCEISQEGAERIFQEITHLRERELSLDELEAVAGGADRDWLDQGCAATVEPGSWCWSNDNCVVWDVTYDHAPTEKTCQECGGMMYYADMNLFKCIVCGATEIDNNWQPVHLIPERIWGGRPGRP